MRWNRIGSLIRWETNPKPEPWHWDFPKSQCQRFSRYCLSVRQGHIMVGTSFGSAHTEVVALCCLRTVKTSSFGVVRRRLNSSGRPHGHGHWACLCDSAIFELFAGVREFHQAQGESGRLVWLPSPLRMQPSKHDRIRTTASRCACFSSCTARVNSTSILPQRRFLVLKALQLQGETSGYKAAADAVIWSCQAEPHATLFQHSRNPISVSESFKSHPKRQDCLQHPVRLLSRSDCRSLLTRGACSYLAWGEEAVRQLLLSRATILPDNRPWLTRPGLTSQMCRLLVLSLAALSTRFQLRFPWTALSSVPGKPTSVPLTRSGMSGELRVPTSSPRP